MRFIIINLKKTFYLKVQRMFIESYKVSENKAAPKVFSLDNRMIFDYPCSDNFDCAPYEIVLKPGTYRFDTYGASGGFTTINPSSYRNETTKNCVFFQ